LWLNHTSQNTRGFVKQGSKNQGDNISVIIWIFGVENFPIFHFQKGRVGDKMQTVRKSAKVPTDSAHMFAHIEFSVMRKNVTDQ
jgi:hypothetical protein